MITHSGLIGLETIKVPRLAFNCLKISHFEELLPLFLSTSTSSLLTLERGVESLGGCGMFSVSIPSGRRGACQAPARAGRGKTVGKEISKRDRSSAQRTPLLL